jgi:hypothetical membrane protein
MSRSSRTDRWAVAGAVLWLLRPVYVVIELLVAARTTGDYSLTEDTVSALGATGCSGAYCSPWHGVINGTFVGIGILLVLGALLLAARLGPAVTVLLCLAGASSVATGLAPVDQDATLHLVAAAPLFFALPVATVLLARRMWSTRPRLSRVLLLSVVVTAGGAVGFAAGVPGTGAFERLALWPPLVVIAAVGVAVVRPRADLRDAPPPRRGSPRRPRWTGTSTRRRTR